MAMEITRDVKPLGNIEIKQICVELNSQDERGFYNDIFADISARGFRTLAKQAAFEGECRYSLTYTVSWASALPRWPVAVNISVWDNTSQIGYVRYDASRGSSRPDRVGTAIGKVHPLLDEMFADVTR